MLLNYGGQIVLAFSEAQQLSFCHTMIRRQKVDAKDHIRATNSRSGGE